MKRLLLLMIVAGCSDSSPQSGEYAPPEPVVAETPAARVTAFIQDWKSAWAHIIEDSNQHAPDESAAALERWKTAEERVRRLHFTSDSPERVFSGSVSLNVSAHDPQHEQIIRTEASGDRAVVETQVGTRPDWYFEYELQRSEGDWKIARLRRFLDAAGEPLFEPEQKSRILKQIRTDAPLSELSREWKTAGNDLFVQGREISPDDDLPETISVHRAGSLQLSAGIIGVHDFGFINDRFRPLSRSVAPGNYPVEYATIGRLEIAVRVIISDETVVEWKPASRLDSEDFIVGVDTGNVAVFDADALMSLTKRELERRYSDWTDVAEPGGAVPLRLASRKDEAVNCILVNSGYGDGAYPCYWGLDENGEIASLLIDFLIVGAEEE